MTAPDEETAHIEVESVCETFGRRQVFRDLSCRFPRAKVSVLMGGSGSGKSTLLRLIAGLAKPDSGQIRIAGEDIVSLREGELKRVRRRLGMLFQNGALLDAMTVFENVALPLREHSALDEDDIATVVHDRLKAVGLEDVDDLLPGELSGGMLRRVALARAIVEEPEILLCDEPFSGLDPPNVDRIEALLCELNRELGLTVIVTSHHVTSARRMGHQIVLLFDGQAVSGSPVELTVSRDPRVMEFLRIDATGLGRTGASVDLS